MLLGNMSYNNAVSERMSEPGSFYSFKVQAALPFKMRSLYRFKVHGA
jgi:hypothetical protein